MFTLKVSLIERIFPGENGPVGGGIDSRIGGVVESPKFGDDWKLLLVELRSCSDRAQHQKHI
ncbi:hypothetical protein Avbf_01433 [Armadillidium vulgare]|nr:hypothetical protein Avbf_01433 [Armadillidium vulgare]